MKSCALFDTDGTLVNISKVVAKMFGAATREVIGIKYVPDDLPKYKQAGVHMRDLFSDWMQVKGFLPAETERLWPEVKTKYEVFLTTSLELVDHGRSYRCAGASKFLNLLKAKKVPCGVFSGAPDRIHIATLNAAGFTNYFSARIPGDLPAVPTRDGLVLRCFENLKEFRDGDLDISHAVVFGDTPNDIDGASKCGAKSVLIRSASIYDKADFIKRTPTKIYNSFLQYRKIFKEMFPELR